MNSVETIECKDCGSYNITLCGPLTIDRPEDTQDIHLSACCPDCGASYWIIYKPIELFERK